MKHINPFDFNFGIKFVDASTAGAGSETNDFNLVATGDMLGLIIGFILLAVAIGAFAFYFIKRRNDSCVMAHARRVSHARTSVKSNNLGTSLWNKFILALGVVALICSGFAIAHHTVQAFAEGSTPIIKAYVADDGSISVKPLNFRNKKSTDIKFQITCADLWGECYGDEQLLQSNLKLDSDSETIWNSAPDGFEFYPEVHNRIEVGQTAHVPIEISNLDGEYAKSLIGSNVYFFSLTFEDAIVPYPEIVDEYVYDGKFHTPVPTESLYTPYYLDAAGNFYEREACDYDESNEPIPYEVNLMLKPGFAWENPTAAPKYNSDPYEIKWVIKKRSITPQWMVNKVDWDVVNKNCSCTYDGFNHDPIIPSALNLLDGHEFILKAGEPSYRRIDSFAPVDVEHCVDAGKYSAYVSTDGFEVIESSTGKDLSRNYEVDNSTTNLILDIYKKDLNISWDSRDRAHEYDGETFRPFPFIEGICSRINDYGVTIKDDVKAVLTYYDKSSGSIDDPYLPKFQGEYYVCAEGLTGEQADNYNMTGVVTFDYRIDPRSSKYTSIKWDSDNVFYITGEPINPKPLGYTGILTSKGDSIDIEDMSQYTYYKYNEVTGEWNEIADVYLKDEGKYCVDVEPLVKNDTYGDISSSYEFDETQKHYEFSIVTPVISFDWSGVKDHFDFNGNSVPVADTTPKVVIEDWSKVRKVDVEEVKYIKKDSRVQIESAIDAGDYYVVVTKVLVTPKSGEQYVLSLDSGLIVVASGSSDQFAFTIDPAKVKVNKDSWKNVDPGKHEATWSEDSINLNYDTQLHNKYNNDLSSTIDAELPTFIPTDYKYYSYNDSHYGEILSANVISAGTYKVEVVDFRIDAASTDNSHLNILSNYVLDTDTASLEYKINPRDFGNNPNVKIELLDDFDYPERCSYTYDTKAHKPFVRFVKDTFYWVSDSSEEPTTETVTLIDEIDYRVSPYTEETKVGNYQINIQGIGNYSSEVVKVVDWSIVKEPASLWYKYDGDGSLILSATQFDGSTKCEQALNPGSTADIDWLNDERKSSTTEIKVIADSDPAVACKIQPLSMDSWFEGFEALTNISGLAELDTSHLSRVYRTFYGCKSLTSANISWMNTQNVDHNELPWIQTFDGCSALSTITIGKYWNPYLTMDKICLPGEWRTDKQLSYDKTTMLAPGTYYKKQLFFGMDESTLHISAVKTAIAIADGSSALSGSDVPWSAATNRITTVCFDGGSDTKITPSSMKNWFSDCTALTKVEGTDNIETSEVQEISGMFNGCSSLASLDFSWLNTNNVIYTEKAANMLAGCDSLNHLTIGAWNQKLTFNTIGLAGTWRTDTINPFSSDAEVGAGEYSRVQFYYGYDESIFTLVLSPVKTSIADKDAAPALYAKDIDGIPWQTDTNNIKAKAKYIQYATPVSASLDTPVPTVQPISMENWFLGFEKLTDISGLRDLDTSRLTDIFNLFNGCSALVDADLAWMNTMKVNSSPFADMHVFEGCDSLVTITIGDNWNSDITIKKLSLPGDWRSADKNLVSANDKLSKGTYFKKQLFYGIAENEDGETTLYLAADKSDNATIECSDTLSAYYDPDLTIPWFSSKDSIKCVEFEKANEKVVTPFATAAWFAGMSNLTKVIGTDNIDTSLLKDVSYMFSSCTSLVSIDLSWLNTKNLELTPVQELWNNIFLLSGCTSLTTVTFGMDLYSRLSLSYVGLDGSWKSEAYNPYDIERKLEPGRYDKIQLFYGYDNSGTILTISANKTDKTGNECAAALDSDGTEDVAWLKSDNKLTTKVVQVLGAEISPSSMNSWFSGFRSLNDISGLSSMNTSSVTNIDNLFKDCQGLIFADLSWMDTKNVTAEAGVDLGVFSGCNSLNTLKVTDKWNPYITMINLSIEGDWRCSDEPLWNKEKPLMPGTYYKNELYYGVSTNNGATTLYLAADKTKNAKADGSSALNLDTHAISIPWSSLAKDITNVVFEDCNGKLITPTTMDSWFANFESLVDVSGFENIDTSRLTSVSGAFYNCSSLETIDLSWLNTKKLNIDPEITNIHLFEKCNNLNCVVFGDKLCTGLTFNLTGLQGEWIDKNSNVCKGDDSIKSGAYNKTKLYYGFDESSKILTLSDKKTDETDVYCASALYANSVKDVPWQIDEIKLNCSRVKVLDDNFFSKLLSATAGIHPVSLNSWFSGFTALTDISDLSKLDTSKVTDINSMFMGCASLTTADMTWLNTDNINSSNLAQTSAFAGCESLTSLTVGKHWNSQLSIDNLSVAGYWIDGKGNLINSDSSLDADVYTRPECYYGLNDGVLTISPAKCDMAQISADKSLFAERVQDIAWNSSSIKIDKVNIISVNDKKLSPLSMAYWFCACENLLEINGFENINTKYLSSLKCMLYYCNALTDLDLSAFNIAKSKVTVGEDSNMFNGCYNLESIKIGQQWNTSISINGAGLKGLWKKDDSDVQFNNDYGLVNGTYTRYSAPVEETADESDNPVNDGRLKFNFYEISDTYGDYPIDTSIEGWTLNYHEKELVVYAENYSDRDLYVNINWKLTYTDGNFIFSYINDFSAGKRLLIKAGNKCLIKEKIVITASIANIEFFEGEIEGGYIPDYPYRKDEGPGSLDPLYSKDFNNSYTPLETEDDSVPGSGNGNKSGDNGQQGTNFKAGETKESIDIDLL